MQRVRCNVHDATCKMQCVNGSASQTSWTDQLDGPAGRTSSLYLKPWPVRTFKDWHLSLYIVAASESDEGLVLNKVPSYLTAPIHAKIWVFTFIFVDLCLLLFV